MSTEQNKNLVRRLYDEVWNKDNLSVIDEYLAPDYEDHDSEYGNQLLSLNDGSGQEALKHSTIALRTAFPDVRLLIEDQIAEGDEVVTRWKAIARRPVHWVRFLRPGSE